MHAKLLYRLDTISSFRELMEEALSYRPLRPRPPNHTHLPRSNSVRGWSLVSQSVLLLGATVTTMTTVVMIPTHLIGRPRRAMVRMVRVGEEKEKEVGEVRWER